MCLCSLECLVVGCECAHVMEEAGRVWRSYFIYIYIFFMWQSVCDQRLALVWTLWGGVCGDLTPTLESSNVYFSNTFSAYVHIFLSIYDFVHDYVFVFFVYPWHSSFMAFFGPGKGTIFTQININVLFVSVPMFFHFLSLTLDIYSLRKHVPFLVLERVQ